MNTFFYKLAMLVMFILAVASGWFAVYMAFDLPLWNILLGILAVFFLFRALELVDRVNKLGPYNDEGREAPKPDNGPRLGKGAPDSRDEESEES